MSQPVLFKRHFQVAYIADDARAGIDVLGRHYGVTKWDLLDMAAVHGAGGPTRFIANAWVGDLMIEVIEPDEAVESIYRNWRKDSPSKVRFHHLGFLVDSDEEMTAAKQHLAACGFPIVVDGSFGDVLDYAYADTTAELGHFYEMIRLKEQGEAFFARIPVN